MGTPGRMWHVASLVTAGETPVFVVLSAMSGTTNSLVEISERLYRRDVAGARGLIDALEERYARHAVELHSDPVFRERTLAFVAERFAFLRSLTEDIFTSFEQKAVVAQGEILSTNMVANYLEERGHRALLIPALDFMRTDGNGEPDQAHIGKALGEILGANPGYEVYMTQGFICRNAFGEVDNLKRGGSDYTASLVGAAVGASEIQIWTDIDGMHNNDPRVVDGTEAVRQLSFDEAAELAYFGAKILHPTCVLPARKAGIPVRLLNTMDPGAPGTMINDVTVKGRIKAVAAKDNITAIKIKSGRMLLATGFLRRVFEIFERHSTAIDMVTTSEVGVSMSVDDDARLPEIVAELGKLGDVTVDGDMCIICVVGDLDWSNVGFETWATDAMKSIPVRMISYGGSNHNISFLVRAADKARALRSLSDTLFRK